MGLAKQYPSGLLATLSATRNHLLIHFQLNLAMRIASVTSMIGQIIVINTLALVVKTVSGRELLEGSAQTAAIETDQSSLTDTTSGLSRISHNSEIPPGLIPDDKVPYLFTFDFDAICVRLFIYQNMERIDYAKKTVECDQYDRSGRGLDVTCSATHIIHSPGGYLIRHPGADVTLKYECPPNTICQPVQVADEIEGGQRIEVGCVGDNDVHTDVVTTPAFGDPYASDYFHCGDALQVPGPQFSAAAGQKTIEIVLTEQVKYPNGSSYQAPALYIHEKGGLLKSFDLVYRRDASVASAQIELGMYRGRWQTREFEFCIKFRPSKVATSVVFVYSFLQLHRRP